MPKYDYACTECGHTFETVQSFSEDALTDPRGSELVERLAGSADKTLVIYDDLFHEIFNEPEQAVVLDAVITWGDALFTPWPKANVIIGNPPYRRLLGNEPHRLPEVGQLGRCGLGVQVGRFLVRLHEAGRVHGLAGLGDLVAAIPPSLARAMLAGVLLPLCLAPVTALVDTPAAVAPDLGLYAVAKKKRWQILEW